MTTGVRGFIGLMVGGTVRPGTTEEQLTLEERRMLATGDLGYCRAHRILYLREALGQCPIAHMGIVCKEHGVVFCNGTGKSVHVPSPLVAEFFGKPCDEWKGS